ncbi:MAG: AIR synthase family protein [Lachnospiraceae bacterium]|nr:AIR synthase family protein [Lachnospiraceae bacterium]
MKRGKLAENAFKRSVLKQIKTKREEVVIGAGVGEDCAVLSLGENCLTAVTVVPVTWQGEHMVRFAVHGPVNDLAASGAEPVAVMVSALLPLDMEEAELRAMMAEAEAECAALGIQAVGGHTEITDAVSRPILTVCGIGKIADSSSASVSRIRAGLDIVASKWIGLGGTSIIARCRGGELAARYPVRFIEEAKEFDRFLSVVPEAATAVKSGVCAMHDVTEGGIFGALWEMAEGAGVGLEIDLKKIPVKQETIEICEFFGINPYELASGGCLLMAADNGCRLVRALEARQIPAVLIGRTTEGRDRVVVNEGERRFLEPPGSDELHKVIK